MEHNNKFLRFNREHHSRKSSPTKSLQDIFMRSLYSCFPRGCRTFPLRAFSTTRINHRLFKHELFKHELKSSWLKSLELKLGVEKSRVEMSCNHPKVLLILQESLIPLRPEPHELSQDVINLLESSGSDDSMLNSDVESD